MLKDKKAFEKVEEALKEKGIIEKFENENGKILGRIMITLTDKPDILDEVYDDKNIYFFECSFDFYDFTLTTGLNVKTKEPVCGIIINGKYDAEDDIDGAWVEFFIKTLVENISEDGSFGIPMYSFVNDKSDFTVVPTMNENE